ncbi:MAG: DUF4276 family protein [Planctomycetaceae bacterium]
MTGSASEWRFMRIGLLVTGKGEEKFLPQFFRVLTTEGDCVFEVIRRVRQLSPIDSPKRIQKMVGRGQTLPSRDEEIGLVAREYLRKPDRFLILVDDLEGDRSPRVADVFRRYRNALDSFLGENKSRAAVHFLVNMLEAYFFADAATANRILGTDLANFDGDVELIRHPKNDLKRIFTGYREIDHGVRIVRELDLDLVLSNPQTCASLRTMIAWCVKALDRSFDERFRLSDGIYFNITQPQIDAL